MIVGYNTLSQAQEKGVLDLTPEAMRLWYNPGGLFERVHVLIPFGKLDRTMELPEHVVYEEWSFGARSRRFALLRALIRIVRAARYVRQTVSGEDLDVVRFNGPNLAGAVGVLLGFRSRFPRALFIEAFWEQLVDDQEYLPKIVKRLLPLWYRIVYRCFDSYCGTPSVDPNYYQARGMKRDRIADWTHEVAVDRLHIERTLGESLEAPPDQGFPRLVTVGRLHAEKKSRDALLVLCAVRQVFPSAQLTYVGDGPERQRLMDEAVERGISDDVHFLGQMGQSDGLRVVAGSDIYLATMQGNALVEALSVGLPIVAYSNPWHRRLILDGQSGLLVPDDRPEAMADAVIAICCDGSLSQRLSVGAREWAFSKASEAAVGHRLADVFRHAYAGFHQPGRRRRPSLSA